MTSIEPDLIYLPLHTMYDTPETSYVLNYFCTRAPDQAAGQTVELVA